ncbi:MAG: hypothetical protein KJN63_04115 [Acidimicrobiia bacterium]|nr:hypothetical protein [Acidimicrobiia bacterium]
MRFRTALALAGTVALILPATALAVPGVDDDATASIEKARVTAAAAASAMLQAEGEGRGLDPDRARGLERAKEVSNSWRFTGEDKPGNGPKPKDDKVTGNARSQQVHEALAAGLSPSAIHNPNIDKPGKELEDAFNGFKQKRDGHPGKGQGKGLGGPGGPDEDDPDDD